MIVADTSAILAIVFAEPERDAFVAAIERAERTLVSSVTVVETRMVVHARRGQRAVVLVDDLLRLPCFEIVSCRGDDHHFVERPSGSLDVAFHRCSTIAEHHRDPSTGSTA